MKHCIGLGLAVLCLLTGTLVGQGQPSSTHRRETETKESPYLRCPADGAKVKEVQKAAAETLGLSVTKEIDLGGGVKMKSVLIPAGEFMMGSPPDKREDPDEGPQHKIKITKPFYMGTYEVTVSEFQRFVSEADYRTQTERNEGIVYCWTGKTLEERKGITWRNPGFKQSKNDPVCCVSWYDAQAFCKWLSGKGETKYRLPTEAEWEYACRAGTTTRFYFGNSDAGLHKYANYADRNAALPWSDNAHDDGYAKTAPVGSFKPNQFGLYDMHGNVSEWCQSRFKSYPYKADDGRESTRRMDDQRVCRGSSWFYAASLCRSANRHSNVPWLAFRTVGFRVISVGPSPSRKPRPLN